MHAGRPAFMHAYMHACMPACMHARTSRVSPAIIVSFDHTDEKLTYIYIYIHMNTMYVIMQICSLFLMSVFKPN